ncbi:hypothetical protein [Paenibacillus mucilaginosus]|uniref:hypothetical protein n=1 Tax=Paenibacillus mucilaginosus TaxID=61624 RepID=UPI003D1D5DB4
MTERNVASVFDPTIYDNLKTVLEGACYDLDAEGAFLITGREDLVDLASYSRTFRLRLRRTEGRCEASVALVSDLADFAGELRKVHIAGEAPGARVQLELLLPLSVSGRREAVEAYLSEQWEQSFRMEFDLVSPWSGESADAGVPAAGQCRIRMMTTGKLDEGDVEGVEEIGDRLSQTLAYLESLAQSG